MREEEKERKKGKAKDFFYFLLNTVFQVGRSSF